MGWRGRILVATLISGLITPLAAGPLAASTCGCGLQPFVLEVADHSVIALVAVKALPNEGFELTVQQVFKGHVRRSRIAFAGPTAVTSMQRDWRLAIVAFAGDPSDGDARWLYSAETDIWHVTADGRVDPEGDLTYPDMPATLAGWRAYFSVPPATSTDSAAASNSPVEWQPWWIAALISLGSAGVAWLALRRRFVAART